MLQVIYYPPAEKYLRKLKDKNLKLKFKNAIDEIRKDPYIGEPKKGDLAGICGYDVYYNKINYEIAYILQKQPNGSLVVVVMVGTRENFWDTLKNYIK